MSVLIQGPFLLDVPSLVGVLDIDYTGAFDIDIVS